ncbi:MAG: zinc dependent phospholipase C family protein [Kofleriaceae bacterium]|nr:zinc dependent phospholipase C family protein [Kofleriaceae bacterium]
MRITTSARLAGVAAVAAVAAVAVAAPRAAEANGGNTHTWISLHAVEHLPDGKLKELLSRPEVRAMLINGSVFPDGGYVVGDAYGEMSHWEPFVEAYVRWIRDHAIGPLNQGDAAEQVAFLMGLASHGMADQVFDSMFVEAARIEDAAGWSDSLLDSHDTATDVFLVAQEGVNYLDTLPWVPGQVLSGIYADAFDYTVSADQLDAAQELLHRLVLNYGVATAMDPAKVQDYVDRYPWSSAHLLEPTEAGGPPCEGEVVAAYWLALWDRLHEVSGPQNWVIATYPRDGSVGHPIDSSRPESQVAVVFGLGIEKAQLADHVQVTDDAGAVHDVTVTTQWGADEANLARIEPLDDWAPDTTYTVTVSPGLTFNDGTTMDDTFAFTFSTAAGDPGLPTSDPTPHTGEPDVGELPPVADDGGCAAAGGGGGAGALGGAAMALVALGRARRRRR